MEYCSDYLKKLIKLWNNDLAKIDKLYPDKRTENEIKNDEIKQREILKDQEIHIVLFSNGQPYENTKKNIIESINNMNNSNIIIHDFNLEKIKKYEWFKHLKDMPKINRPSGKRDGYYCCYFSFIIKEVYENIPKNSLIYFLACSRFYHNGFTEHFYRLCNLTNKYNFITGHVDKTHHNNSVKNMFFTQDLRIWKEIIEDVPEDLLKKYISGKLVTNSWFILKKTECNDNFVKEWPYFTAVFRNNDFKDPLGTYHHCAEQGIFGMLAYKYDNYVFYDERKLEHIMKSKNEVLKSINQSDDPDKFIIKVRDTVL